MARNLHPKPNALSASTPPNPFPGLPDDRIPLPTPTRRINSGTSFISCSEISLFTPKEDTPTPAAPTVVADAPTMTAPTKAAPTKAAPKPLPQWVPFAGLGVLLLGGGALAASALGGAGTATGLKVVDAARALAVLEQDDAALLVDTRLKTEIKAQGIPDLSSIKGKSRRSTSLPLLAARKVDGETKVTIDAEFGTKLLAKVGGEANAGTPIILLDADGTSARAGALQAVKAGLTQVLVVKGGATGWQSAGAPWKVPSKGLSLDLSSLTKGLDNLAEDFKEQPTIAKGGLALGALAGAGFLLVNEVDVVLELLGTLVVAQFALNSLLYSKDREETIGTVKKVIKDDLAVQDAGEDLKSVARALFDEDPSMTDGAARKEKESTKKTTTKSTATTKKEEVPIVSPKNPVAISEYGLKMPVNRVDPPVDLTRTPEENKKEAQAWIAARRQA